MSLKKLERENKATQKRPAKQLKREVKKSAKAATTFTFTRAVGGLPAPRRLNA